MTKQIAVTLLLLTAIGFADGWSEVGWMDPMTPSRNPKRVAVKVDSQKKLVRLEFNDSVDNYETMKLDYRTTVLDLDSEGLLRFVRAYDATYEKYLEAVRRLTREEAIHYTDYEIENLSYGPRSVLLGYTLGSHCSFWIRFKEGADTVTFPLTFDERQGRFVVLLFEAAYRILG